MPTETASESRGGAFEWLAGKSPPRILGHRGVMGLRPENTMASFREAVRLKCDILELDVHLSKDRELVVIHDERLERTTDGRGWVKDLSSVSLRKLDAGAWFDRRYAGEKIPLLEEVLALCVESGTALNVEIKNGPIFYRGIAGRVIEALRRFAMLERTVISSFDHAVLFEAKEIEPRCVTAPLTTSRFHEPVRYLRRLRADGLHPRWNLVTKELVAELHRAGFFVNTWVINDAAAWRQFRQWRVDAVGTNDPRKLKG